MAHKQILIAAGIALVATPAFGRTPNVEQNKRPVAGAKADTRLYCTEAEALVGSRIGRQTCKTKAEWAREDGVDIDAELKKSAK